MNKALLIALSLCLTVPGMAAADATAQQQRMKDCNAQATGKKGDERKAFMSSCLSGKAAVKASSPQQRMKDCNAQATGKKGDERKAFMSSCLKG